MIKKNISISIKKILLNSENPRFEPVKDQEEAFSLMLNREGKSIVNIGKHIATHGLNPSENIMVMEIPDGYFLTLEGSRRVVALKLLDDPTLGTDKKLIESFKQFKQISRGDIHEVECTVFPDRETAAPWIELKHTGANGGAGVVQWNSVQINRYKSQQTGKQKPVLQLLDFASNNNIDHKVDLTNLERLISTPAIRERIGIDFPQKNLVLKKERKLVIEDLRKVFAEMSRKDFKVADIYTADKKENWIKKILSSSVESKKIDKKHLISKEKNIYGDWITPQLCNNYPQNNRVKSILKELKDLSPISKPNICATSLRVLLELAVYAFLNENKVIESIITKEKEKLKIENTKKGTQKKLEKNWFPNFSRMLEEIAGNEILISDASERKAIDTFFKKNSSMPFVREMNQFVHNLNYHPNAATITEIWKNMGCLLFQNILRSAKNGNNNKKN